MSFSRAKRFDYKPPDLDISPADYDISTKLLEKGVIIPKCPRFRNKKQEEGTNSCHRLNCCRGKPQTNGPCRNKIISKTHSNRTSPDSNKQPPEKTVKESETNVQDLIRNFEKLVNKDSDSSSSPVPSPEEFIDDDYHSYTSSEELESLKKLEEYEFNEVFKAYKNLVLNKTSTSVSTSSHESNVENVLLQKMDKLEQSLESVKEDFNNFNTKLQIEELEKSRSKEQAKIEHMKEVLDKSLEKYSKKSYGDIKTMIIKAIEYLNREFEKKRYDILKESEYKIRRLIDELYLYSDASGEDMTRLCRNTAISLTKRLDSTIKKMNLSLAQSDSNLMLENCNGSPKDKHECFNYENVCKILSDQLQITQDEKDDLELENLDMTLKCSETQQALETQANVIDLLHSEIKALRNYINKKRP